MHEEASLFHSLVGAWDFERVVSGQGAMTGRAVFSPEGPDLMHYREDGVLTLDHGGRFDFFRDYDYRLSGEGIAVAFTDGRPFHRLLFDPAAEGYPRRATAGHACEADLYRGIYCFEGPDRYAVEWGVTGPRKDYTIRTRFARRGL